MLSKSADPSPETPSQAPDGEGVETGWEPPDRVMAKVKAQSRPRTLVERRRKPKWHGIRRVLVRAQEGQLRARRRHARRRASCLSTQAAEANPWVCGWAGVSGRTKPGPAGDRTLPPPAASPRLVADIAATYWYPATRQPPRHP